jgi:hypothetical protein
VLNHDGGNYKQSPYEDCSKETYEALLETLTAVDLTKVVEVEDNTDLSGEIACGAGGCEIT